MLWTMCGRTACALEKENILARLQVFLSRGTKKCVQWNNAACLGKYFPSYNRVPGSFNPVIISSRYASSRCEKCDYVVQEMRWGLIPAFVNNAVEQAAKSSQTFATANARADTLIERPSYRCSIQRGWRCVVVSQGFYEWQRQGSHKKPFFISMSGDTESPLMFMAGLFSMNKEQTLYTYTIITTDAVNVVSDIHDRMPILFDNLDEALKWIDGGILTPIETRIRLSKLSASIPLLKMVAYPVNPAVNSPRYDCPNCVEHYVEGQIPNKLPVVSPKVRTLDSFFTQSADKKEEGPRGGKNIRIKPEDSTLDGGSRKRSSSQESPLKKHFKPEF